MMYSVKYNVNEIEVVNSFDDLSAAMKHAQLLNRFVTISFGDSELVGIFGCASVENGMLPSGDDYTWRKRRPVAM